jgi:hypothetical protein
MSALTVTGKASLSGMTDTIHDLMCPKGFLGGNLNDPSKVICWVCNEVIVKKKEEDEREA